jgi:hypothetical protein
VLDRLRFGVLPPAAARDILRQQAATLAASVSGKTENWFGFWQQLHVDATYPLDALYDALALAWASKWESKD